MPDCDSRDIYVTGGLAGLNQGLCMWDWGVGKGYMYTIDLVVKYIANIVKWSVLHH